MRTIWKKCQSKLGPGEQGSVSMVAIAAVMALGGATLYVQNTATINRNSISEAKKNAQHIQTEADTMSQAARFKALMSSRPVTIDGRTRMVPSVYPLDYFEAKWNLNADSNITTIPDIISRTGVIAIGNRKNKDNNEARLRDRDDISTYVNVFEGRESSVALATPARNFEYVGRRMIPGTLETDAVYVRIKSEFLNEGSTLVQIPVSRPEMANIRLQIKKTSDSTWTDITGGTAEVEAVAYDVRLIGDGVVQSGELRVNGTVIPFGIDPQTGRPTHQARNVLSKDAVLAQSSLQINQTAANTDPNTCVFTGASFSSVEVTYNVQGVGAPETAMKSNQVINFTGPAPARKADIPTAAALNHCKDECPFFSEEMSQNGMTEFENGVSARWMATDYKGSYTQQAVMDNRQKWNQADKKLCINAKKAADAYNANHAKKLEFHWELDATNYRSLREMMSYDIPSCSEQFLFTRGTCGCFAEKTKILMGDGKSEKPIEDLVSSDLVWNPILKKAVGIKRMTKGPENVPMLEITVDGQVLSVTGKHPFPTESGDRQAFTLVPNDRILLEDGRWGTIESIQASNEALGKDVWNLEIDLPGAELEHHYIVANGVITGDLRIQENLQSK